MGSIGSAVLTPKLIQIFGVSRGAAAQDVQVF